MKELITEIRRSHGMSQAEFAKSVGVSDAMVSRLEAGDREPGRKTLAGLYPLCNDEQKARLEEAILEAAGIIVVRDDSQ